MTVTYRDAEGDDDVFVSSNNPLPAADLRPAVVSNSESTANVGISATFNGATRDTNLAYKRFHAYVLSSAAGTLNTEESYDGATWFRLGTVAVTANTPALLDTPVIARYVRAQYVNGAAATTTFRMSTALHR